MEWAYGMTTVPSRFSKYTWTSVTSLRAAGFDKPWLFVDGPLSFKTCEQLATQRGPLSLAGLTVRDPAVRVAGNWLLSMLELYIRFPLADRYALFQDDIIANRYLREYLEQVYYPDRGYLNLYTSLQHQPVKPPHGWHMSEAQGCRGAQGLVFNRPTLITLLSSQYLMARPQDPRIGHKNIDGGVSVAMKMACWKEWIHWPSLLQHTAPERWQSAREKAEKEPSKNFLEHEAEEWLGEDWDPRPLLKTATMPVDWVPSSRVRSRQSELQKRQSDGLQAEAVDVKLAEKS